jgi:hypothetical protein
MLVAVDRVSGHALLRSCGPRQLSRPEIQLALVLVVGAAAQRDVVDVGQTACGEGSEVMEFQPTRGPATAFGAVICALPTIAVPHRPPNVCRDSPAGRT